MASSKRGWDAYCDAAHSRYGLMICCTCNRPITTGLFRARDTERAWVSQHRACAGPDDAGWAKYDADRREALANTEAQLTEYRAFRAKWNEDALDDSIKWLERQVVSLS